MTVVLNGYFMLYPFRFFKIFTVVLLTCALLYFPVRMLIADYYYNKAIYALDDKSTEYMDVQAILADTIGNYNFAIESLKKSAYFAPSTSIYHKALSDIYSKLGRWAGSMDAIDAPLPTGVISKKEAVRNATDYLDKAISIEPTNPDYHMALGYLYDIDSRDAQLAEKEFAKAIAAYPLNKHLRYAIARHYLLTGREGDALEQARILASLDDSYKLPERTTPAYLSRIYKSYLFGALEIAWRISGDKEVIKGIAPDNPEAKDAVMLFLELKGFEE